jgi:sulfoquinovose isomerase
VNIHGDPTHVVIGGPGWRRSRVDDLLDFARRSRVPEGFAWLDEEGRPVPARGLQLWINTRMTYVFSLSSMRGWPADGALAEHGVETLLTRFRDAEHGGWFHSLSARGEQVDGTKTCYGHSFVLLAACAAQAADVPGSDELLDRAVEVHQRFFWDESVGLCREGWNRDWTETEPYRGANSNMHAVEAYLFAADVLGDDRWGDRALSIAERLLHREARAHQWRVVEHFTEGWEPLPFYHLDRPDDPFRPFGATPGHAFEWARLAVYLEASSTHPPRWLLDCARRLFDRAVTDTGAGRAGFCYTTDWRGQPVVTERVHWVLAEAILAADALARLTGEAGYAELATAWWALADTHFVDTVNGSWHHELDADLRPSARIWKGKPDAYHAFNALVFPDLALPPSPSLGAAGSAPA